MSRIPSPIISVVIGEGGSGGALGLGVANRVYMLENAYYSVITPESFAAIIWRDSGKAPLAAAALKMTARDLLNMGVIDGIVPEPPEGAHTDVDTTAQSLKTVLQQALAELSTLAPGELTEQRYLKFRTMGGAFFTEAATL
jgi:acetyl-CoA carboxylase carboxyl transferase subunit alpha